MTFITSLDFVWPCRSEKKSGHDAKQMAETNGKYEDSMASFKFQKIYMLEGKQTFLLSGTWRVGSKKLSFERFEIPSLWQYLAIQAPATEGEFVGQTNILDNKTHQKSEILFINYKKTWILHKCNWDKFSYVNMDFTDISPRDSICL